MSNYKFYLKHGTNTFSFVPLFSGSLDLSQKRDLEKGEVFFRNSLNNIVIGGDEYLYIKALFDSQNCDKITISLEHCGVIKYLGYFTASIATYDFVKCTVNVTLTTQDIYSCFIENYTKEFNLYEIGLTNRISINTDNAELYNGFNVNEAIEGMIVLSGCPFLSGKVKSDFFEWNAIGDAPNYVPGNNYVYGGANEYNLLRFIHNSTIINYPATNPATIMKTSIKEILDLLKSFFKIYWSIADNGDLVLEHISFYFNYPLSYVESTSKTIASNKKHPKMDGYKLFPQITTDWASTWSKITYQNCGEGADIVDFTKFTTDIVAEYNALGNTDDYLGGITLVTVYSSGVLTNAIRRNTCVFQTLTFRINEPLSSSRLTERFGQYYNFKYQYIIANTNLVPPLFPFKISAIEEITTKDCCDINFEKTLIQTNLSQNYMGATIGIVLEVITNIKNNYSKIKVGFGY